MNWKRAAIVWILSGVLVGCNLPGPAQIPASTVTAPAGAAPTLALTVIPPQAPTGALTPAASLAPTVAATAAVDASPLPSPSATSASTQASSSVPFKATVLADGTKIRTGPGTLFPALGMLAKDVQLDVYGRSRGNEWAYVLTADGAHGWVFGLLVQTAKDLKTAPETEPGDVQVVQGRVVDKAGEPVDGIQFAFTQGAGSNPPRTDALTDAEGKFYAYFPATATGTWTVSYTAVACTSRLMDAKCNYKPGAAGSIQPASMQISLSAGTVLSFTWQ